MRCWAKSATALLSSWDLARVMMSLVHDDVCHLFSVCVSLAVDRTAHQFLLTARGEAFYSVIVTHPA